jgi:hypothetical protein
MDHMGPRRLVKTLIVGIGAAALLGGCAASSGEVAAPGSANSSAAPNSSTSPTSSAAPATATAPDATTGDSIPTATEGSIAPMSTDQIDPGLQPYVDIAVADLAKRLSIDTSAIDVQTAVLKVWPDSSLGCPQPGMQYAQVETDGSQIVLLAGGKQYHYHAGGSRQPFLCE